jgi:hypothetical protein
VEGYERGVRIVAKAEEGRVWQPFGFERLPGLHSDNEVRNGARGRFFNVVDLVNRLETGSCTSWQNSPASPKFPLQVPVHRPSSFSSRRTQGWLAIWDRGRARQGLTSQPHPPHVAGLPYPFLL